MLNDEQKVEPTSENGNSTKPHVLRSCPFCGAEPELILRGNAHTKSRSAEVYCRSCHTKQVTGAIHNSLAWCEDKAVDKWNRRSGA